MLYRVEIFYYSSFWYKFFSKDIICRPTVILSFSPWQLLNVTRSGMLLCGVPTRNSAPIPSSTRNTNSTRVDAVSNKQMNLSSHNPLSWFWCRFSFNIKTSRSLSNSSWCLCICAASSLLSGLLLRKKINKNIYLYIFNLKKN